MKPVTYFQDWQLGITIVSYDDSVAHMQHIPFGNDYQALYENKIYQG